MKKNIQINICGTIYAIDEDAYQLLENYLESMKNYFRNQDGGEEIADDIEHRVAELLWEAKQNGMEAVNIDTIKDIMNKVGNPTEIDEEASAGHSAANEQTESEYAEYTEQPAADDTLWEKVKRHMRDHRLYRDGENKMIGGVIAGLAGYVGKGDVTLWRLATVVIAFALASIDVWFLPDFLGLLLPVAYLAMLVIVPVASTPEDRLRMKGKQVTPDSIRDQVVSDQEQREAADRPRRSSNGGCLKALLWVFALIMLLPLFAAFFGVILAIVMLLPATFGFSAMAVSVPGLEWIPELIALWGTSIWILLIALLVVIVLPINFFITLLRGNSRSMGSGTVISMILIWLIAVAVAISAGFYGGSRTKQYYDEKRAVEATRNGITLGNKWQWDALGEMGWNLTQLANAEKWLCEDRTGFAGLPFKSLDIKRDDKSKTISFAFEKTEQYDEGTYVLESLTHVEGRGAVISAVADKADLAVINPDNAGSDLSQMSWGNACQMPIFHNPDSTEWDDFAHESTPWAYHVTEPFHHNGGNITIRISARDSHLNRLKVRHVQLRKL